MKKNTQVKVIIFLSIILCLGAAYVGYKNAKDYKVSNVLVSKTIDLKGNETEAQLMEKLQPVLKDANSFKTFAEDKNLFKNFKKGHYKIKEGMSNSELVHMLVLGDQAAENFRIIDFDNVYQMIGRVSRKSATDSATFVKKLDSIAVTKGGRNAEDLKKYFFIDTYQFFWTTTPEEFFATFNKQYDKFWNADRIAKEQKLGLTRVQVYALASIVYKESGGKKDEMKTIAGLYLNRYRKGMKLQSDPTVIYAVNNANGFKSIIKRVYYKDLKTPSPYNTYMNAGIPPGPICITDKSSVDAVLDAESHPYIYMCADPKKPGYHRFTADGQEHMRNAQEYQQWLNSRNIK